MAVEQQKASCNCRKSRRATVIQRLYFESSSQNNGGGVLLLVSKYLCRLREGVVPFFFESESDVVTVASFHGVKGVRSRVRLSKWILPLSASFSLHAL